MEIKKIVIPAAGYGTRFLPFTKTVPKEMLPLLNKPAIQYGIQEGLNSNINQFVIVTNKSKQALVNYFDSSEQLTQLLKKQQKESLIADVAKIIYSAHFTYIRQSSPLGLGHAIAMAKHSIGNEHFGVLLPDDIIVGEDPGLAQLMRIAHEKKAQVIAVQEVRSEDVSSYGIIQVKKQLSHNLFQVGHIVEKPQIHKAPSNIAVIGRYILSPKVFSALDEVAQYAVKEIQLTDALTRMINKDEPIFAYKIKGTRYDIGTPIGWIKGIVGLALQNKNYSSELQLFLSELGYTKQIAANNKNKSDSTHT